jgi:hypothetical protein
MSTVLAELYDLDKAELRDCWKLAYDSAPPPRLGCDTMMLALGWRVQAKANGGFNRDTRGNLARLIANMKAGRGITSGGPSIQPRLTPGTSLVREWHGAIHQVQVLDKGYVWNDKVWNSLSAIAREITGARWNGPAFFGLRSKRIPGKKEQAYGTEEPVIGIQGRSVVGGAPS